MATTEEGIYYQNDYSKKADVPADMKKMAESVDAKVKEHKQEIVDIKQEQTTQNTNIQKNTTDISDLDINKASKTELQEATLALQAELKQAQEEIERQNKDYEAGTLEGQAEGESLYLQDSSDARFREFEICGNSKQATRTGKSRLDLSKVEQTTRNGITCTYNKEDDSVTFNGTCTTDNTLLTINNDVIKAVINKTTLTAYYISGSCEAIGNARLRLYDAEWSKNIYIDFEKLASAKTVSSICNFSDRDLTHIDFRINEGTVLNDFTLKAMVTDDVDTEYERYGAMPSMQFSSEVKAVGQDVNIFDSSIFEDIEQNGVKIKRNVDGTLTLNGTYAGTSAWNYRFNLLEPISVDKEELYLSMQKIKGNCTGQIRFTAWEQNNDNRWLSFETSQYSNLLEGSTYAKASISIFSGATFDNLTIGLKISNKKDAIYSPYNHGSANTVVENKNKLDFSKWNNATASHGTIEQVENGIKLTATANDCYTNTFAYKFQGTLNRDKIECYGFIAKPNTKYTFSCKVNNIAISKRISMFFSDKDYNIISYVTSATSVLTATTPENCKYITIRVGVTNTGDSLIFTDFQLEVGETATDVVAHEEQTFTIDVQQEMLEGDYFDLDNMEEVHTWGKVIFDGTENWAKSINTNNILFYIPDIFPYKDGTILCNYFKAKDVWDKDVIGIQLYPVNGVRFGLGVNSSIDTVDKWKAKLQELYNAGNPLTIYYKLAEPTKLPFTEVQKTVAKQIREKLHSYKGGTHVYGVDEISPIFNVKYTIDQKAYIQAEINKMQAMILAE